MPRFFFDVTDEDQTTVDHEGQDLASADAAHEAAVHALREISTEPAPTTNSRAVQVAVLDGTRHVICIANVTFDPGKLKL